MTPRILMLISNFHPVLAGAEQQALNLSRMLTARKIPVSVLTRARKGEKSFENIDDIPVYRSIHVLDHGKFFGLTYIISTFYSLFKLRNSYDIIHCHIADGLGHMAALLIRCLFNKKIIVKIALSGPLSDFNRLKKTGLNRICLKCLHYVDKIITICTWSKDEALDEGFSESKIAFIPNGVNIHIFHPSPTKKASPDKITYLGRLSDQKGIDVLLRALSVILNNRPELTLDIIGEGSEKRALINMAEELRIKNKVFFHGANQAPYELLIKSSLFILPSRSEGMPNVLLEAMSCGLPVVATKVGGNIDLIQSGENGILVEKENPKQLANAINMVLNDKKLAEHLGKNARETVVRKYSMEHTVSRYIELYAALLTAK